MTDVVEVNDLTTLRTYHLAWTALHGETRGASFFQTFEWFENYWNHCGEGKRMRVLVVRADGRPIGIVPLVEQTEATHVGRVRVLTYPLDSWGPWFGPVGASQAAILALAMRHVASRPKTWDVFRPRWTAHETHDRGRTECAMRLAGLRPAVATDTTTSVVETGGFENWEAYLASRTRKARRELRRQRRKLHSEHDVEYVRYRPEPLRNGGGDPRWDLFRECMQVAEQSWQAESTTGNTLCHRSVACMVHDAHEQAARLGMVDVNLLYVDGQPAAYLYGYHCRGEVYALRTGYDPRVTIGAGAVLLGHIVEDSIARRDTSLDLGPGDYEFKRRLRTATPSSTSLTYVAPHAWRPRALEAAKWCVRKLGGAA